MLAGLLFLIAVQYFAGNGLLRIFRLPVCGAGGAALAMLCGIAILSLLPFLLQLCCVPITFLSVLAAIIITTALLYLPTLFRRKLKQDHIRHKPRPQWSEAPFLIFIAFLLLASAVRCWYEPPKARDVLSGPEAVAEYTVREHTMINSVLSVDLQTTNNHLKPPFVTCLQIIYKLFGMPFGQLWIIILAISFTVWLWWWLRQVVHPSLAGLLLLLFTAVPDLYAYTHIILWDYSNMVFFFLGVYFLQEALKSRQQSVLLFSALLFGLATYIRIETVLFIGLLLPLVVLHKPWPGLKQIVKYCAILLAIPFLFYLLWVIVFLKLYMPEGFSVASQLNTHLTHVAVLWQRFRDINTQLIFCSFGIELWGYFLFLFCALLICELALFRSIKQEARWWLYAVAVVYFVLPILGYLTPWADLDNTTKRGLFKLMPFVLGYMATCGPVQWLSSRLYAFDGGPLRETYPAGAAPRFPRT